MLRGYLLMCGQAVIATRTAPGQLCTLYFALPAATCPRMHSSSTAPRLRLLCQSQDCCGMELNWPRSSSSSSSWRVAGTRGAAALWGLRGVGPGGARAASSLVSLPLAQTGEGISECELVQWFVKEGDVVREFDKLCEVQSDKATIEITSRYSGVLRRLHAAPSDIVKAGTQTGQQPSRQQQQQGDPPSLRALASVGAPLADIEVEGELPPGALLAAQAHGGDTPPPPATPQPPTVQVGGAEQQPGMGAAAPPAGPPAPPPPLPVPVVQHAAGQAEASSNQSPPPLSSGSEEGQDESLDSSSSSRVGGEGEGEGVSQVLAAPAVRRLARELGVALQHLALSCPGGRVRREDVIKAAAQQQAASSSPPPPAPSPQASPGPSPPQAAEAPRGATTRLPLRGYRRAMVRSMTAVAAVPHFHFHDEVGVDALLRVRQTLRGEAALAGLKLTLLPFIIKALSLTLAHHPLLNASLLPDGQSLELHHDHNVGVAMATPSGLVVPVIHKVQQLSCLQVAQELARLQSGAAAGKLAAEEVSGGTITVTNIGSIGGLWANPLVNPPEVAIVALGRARQVPALVTPGGHRVEAPGGLYSEPSASRSVMGVSWGADHRVVDGAALAHASNAWKRLLEAPEIMLLAMR
ncbi:2-oxoacid dehydrogenases acyltransferase-domain-containing protein [Haematococcus lacustris]